MSEPEDERSLLEARLGHAFQTPALLEMALAHPSFAHETDGSRGNERLEFLGDAVLGLVVGELLYAAHPEWNEGALTRARAAIVNARALAERARALELGAFVRLGRTEQRTRGREKESILANVLEALLGGIYLDGGLPAARAFVERVLEEELQRAPLVRRDAKTSFQEWAHARFRETPSYRMVGDTCTDADAERFEVEVWVGEESWGHGVGRTKRQAEQRAAERALERAERTP